MVRRVRRRSLTPAMNAKNPSSETPANAAIIASPANQESATSSGKTHREIKLGVDVHWRGYVVVRQVDGTAPQPAQRFTPDAFIAWVAKQVAQSEVVHCCYEAGPFGFVLHRRLVALGVISWEKYFLTPSIAQVLKQAKPPMEAPHCAFLVTPPVNRA